MHLFRVISLFPEMIQGALSHGLLGQAIEKKLLEVQSINPRDFTQDKHRTVDDRPFGGGDGMVLLPEVLAQVIEPLKAQGARIIYLSPQGPTFTAAKAQEISQAKDIVLVCGRYGGIDQRIINQFVDEELSIGDYVLNGGELAALVVIEASSRFIPGVLGHSDSAVKDSFGDGLLEHPHFTKPREFAQQSVPEVLLSGNHALIDKWKRMLSLLVTYKKRRDLYDRYIRLHGANFVVKKKSLHWQVQQFYQEISENDKIALGIANIHFEDIND